MTHINSHGLGNILECGNSVGPMAEGAAQSLKALVDERRRRDERVLLTFEAMRKKVESLREELAMRDRQIADLTAEKDNLNRNYVIISQNQRRLYMGFVSLLKSIEDTCGSQFAVDQRIEATLLSNDIGGSLGEQPDLMTQAARQFISSTTQN